MCVFSVENVCEHWPAAEWEEIMDGLSVFCVGTLESVVREDEEYSMYWCFYFTQM